MQVRFIAHDMMQRIIPTGSVRSVGNYFTIFAIESFVDELAEELKLDPLTLRLSLLRVEDGMQLNVLETQTPILPAAQIMCPLEATSD